MSMRYALSLRPLRQRRGLTQQQLADKVGVEQPTVGRWEKNQRFPDIDNLLSLAEALDVHPGELFFDAENPATQVSVLSEEDLMALIADAQAGLPAGLPYSEWPRSVAAGLRLRIEQLAGVGPKAKGRQPKKRDDRDEGDQPPPPTS